MTSLHSRTLTTLAAIFGLASVVLLVLISVIPTPVLASIESVPLKAFLAVLALLLSVMVAFEGYSFFFPPSTRRVILQGWSFIMLMAAPLLSYYSILGSLKIAAAFSTNEDGLEGNAHLEAVSGQSGFWSDASPVLILALSIVFTVIMCVLYFVAELHDKNPTHAHRS